MSFVRSVLFLALLSGCGVSPLLNHVNADTLVREREAVDPACPLHFARTGYCASLTWETMPTDDVEGEFTLRFWKPDRATASGPYADPAPTVAVKLWMPAMGHGSAPVTVTRETEGVYRATGASFVMPGEWEIQVQLKNGVQMLEQVVQGITI
jgi:hypothetical protein